MNPAELSDSVATSLGLSKAEGKKAVDAIFAAIADAAAKGDEVAVNGFGKFKVKESAAREGPQSLDRRDDPDRGVEEVRLRGRQGRQGSSQRLIPRLPPALPAGGGARHPVDRARASAGGRARAGLRRRRRTRARPPCRAAAEHRARTHPVPPARRLERFSLTASRVSSRLERLDRLDKPVARLLEFQRAEEIMRVVDHDVAHHLDRFTAGFGQSGLRALDERRPDTAAAIVLVH